MADNFPGIPTSRGSGFGPSRPRIRKVSFGDGYEQAAAEGLNPLKRTYDARFNARPNADIETIRAFLSERGGHTPFLFAPLGEAAAIQWRCETWEGPTAVSATHASLRATFIEDFSP